MYLLKNTLADIHRISKCETLVHIFPSHLNNHKKSNHDQTFI
jgi:hypothetical protein